MTRMQLYLMAKNLVNDGYELYTGESDAEFSPRDMNIRILGIDNELDRADAETLFDYICDIKASEYENKVFKVKPYWLHDAFSNEFEFCDDSTRFTFDDAQMDALDFEMGVVEYIEKYLDVVE